MVSRLEYHSFMRRLNVSLASLLSGLAAFLLVPLSLAAQVNAPASSVTSPGFGGRAINGPRASVTSPGPQGYAPLQAPFVAAGIGFRHGSGQSWNGRNGSGNDGNGHRGDHRRHRDYYGNYGPVWYAVPYYSPYDYGYLGSAAPDDQAEDDENSADYQGGPTIFDRRGSGPNSYIPPAKDATPAHAPTQNSVQEDQPPAEPEPPQPATVLVFKDGHTLETSNYAIVGSTLFDLTTGHRRRIPLSDLDLQATRKQNDEHGVLFQLPQSSQTD